MVLNTKDDEEVVHNLNKVVSTISNILSDLKLTPIIVMGKSEIPYSSLVKLDSATHVGLLCSFIFAFFFRSPHRLRKCSGKPTSCQKVSSVSRAKKNILQPAKNLKSSGWKYALHFELMRKRIDLHSKEQHFI